MLSEEHTEDFDIEETNNKLGVLWTWGFDPGGSQQPIYTVLAAEEVHKTVAMMPALGAKHSKLEHQTRGLQEQVSDGRSHAPAVPKAVQMLGLTADRFYMAVIICDKSERLYRQIPEK